MFIYDASVLYQKEGVPLLILAGKEYGSGSSRDWAAKGVALLGVRAVIAESFERIHRTNLVGMGVLPLQFQAGENAAGLGLTGKETFHIEGVGAARSTAARPRCARWRMTAPRRASRGGAGGHPAGSGILPQRRDFAVRAEAVGGGIAPSGSYLLRTDKSYDRLQWQETLKRGSAHDDRHHLPTRIPEGIR